MGNFNKTFPEKSWVQSYQCKMGTSNRKTNIMEEGNLNKIFLKNHVENGINVRGELQFLTNHREENHRGEFKQLPDKSLGKSHYLCKSGISNIKL